MTEPASTELLSVAETCRAVRLSQRSVYNLLNRGELRAVKLGRRTYLRKSEIDRFLRELPAYESAA